MSLQTDPSSRETAFFVSPFNFWTRSFIAHDEERSGRTEELNDAGLIARPMEHSCAPESCVVGD